MMGNKSTASVTLGDVQGVFVKPKEPNKLETVSFVYSADTNLSVSEGEMVRNIILPMEKVFKCIPSS